jgi:hypothetical protein
MHQTRKEFSGVTAEIPRAESIFIWFRKAQGVLKSTPFLQQLSSRPRVTIHTSHLVELLNHLYGSSKASLPSVREGK